MFDNTGSVMGCSSCAEKIRLLEAQLAAKDATLVAKEAELELLKGRLKGASELEISNSTAKQQSQIMLKHFACMSHEIRSVVFTRFRIFPTSVCLSSNTNAPLL